MILRVQQAGRPALPFLRLHEAAAGDVAIDQLPVPRVQRWHAAHEDDGTCLTFHSAPVLLVAAKSGC